MKFECIDTANLRSQDRWLTKGSVYDGTQRSDGKITVRGPTGDTTFFDWRFRKVEEKAAPPPPPPPPPPKPKPKPELPPECRRDEFGFSRVGVDYMAVTKAVLGITGKEKK